MGEVVSKKARFRSQSQLCWRVERDRLSLTNISPGSFAMAIRNFETVGGNRSWAQKMPL